MTAALSYLTGNLGLSKRNVEELATDLFGAPIALGTVANLEQEVSAALAPAHQEALAAVRQAEVKFADETSWKLSGKLCWLWAAATASIAVFVVHAKRSAVGLAAILGDDIYGILHSDRWNVYLQVPAERRQLCWAHLKRDFQKIVDCGGPSVFVGRRGLCIVKEVFAAWHAFQAGTVTRQKLQELMEPLQRRLSKALVEGGLGDDALAVRAFVRHKTLGVRDLLRRQQLFQMGRMIGLAATFAFGFLLLDRFVRTQRISGRRRGGIGGVGFQTRFQLGKPPFQVGNASIPFAASMATRSIHAAMLGKRTLRSCASFAEIR